MPGRKRAGSGQGGTRQPEERDQQQVQQQVGDGSHGAIGRLEFLTPPIDQRDDGRAESDFEELPARQQQQRRRAKGENPALGREANRPRLR